MLENISIRSGADAPLVSFLEQRDYEVEQVTETVAKITRFDEIPVFVHVESDTLYFEVDLGGIGPIATQELCFKLLDLNTEILPVSVGIDSTDPDDPRLVLVESRESQNLDENEVLSVFNALEIATDKVEAVLAEYVS